MWTKARPMDDGKRLITQAAQVKAINPKTHIWVYRNLVKALSWYNEVGNKIADPAYAGWFLKFRPGGAVDLGNKTGNPSWHSDPCTGGVCSELFHSQDQTPKAAECGDHKCDCGGGGIPCGEYIWDHRNESLREWLIGQHVMGPLGMGNANVTGFYFDDEWARSGHGWATLNLPGDPRPYNISDCEDSGPSEIEAHCLLDMGLTARDVHDLVLAWRNTTAQVLRAVHRAGGWAWQMFTEAGPPEPTANVDSCIEQYRGACQPTSKQQQNMCSYKLTLSDRHSPGSLTDPDGDVAKFLILRGPYAFLGTAWVGCVGEGTSRHSNESYVRPPSFERDYGTPVGLCKETAAGVFAREWTKATAAFDCNTNRSTLTMKV